jgi:8-oxo-dGTP diphosphatase
MTKKITRVAADAVIIKNGKVLLVKRKWPPYKDFWCVPGGKMEYGERFEQTCIREVFEETGLHVKIKELIWVYSDPKRDPRSHWVSTAFLCSVTGGKLKLTRETKDIRWFSPAEVRKMKLAFDHKKMIKDSGFF